MKQEAAMGMLEKLGTLRKLLEEHEREMQRLKIENDWLKKVLEDCEKKRVDEKQMHVIDMTRPRPCMKFRHEPPMLWAAKLTEEVSEVFQASVRLGILYDALDVAINNVDEKAVRLEEDLMAEELTDVITVCISWLFALGYDEDRCGEIQKRVNEKNLARGYWT